MRILVLHSRYRSGSASGENRVVDDEAVLLREAGHEVHLIDPMPPDGGVASRARLGVAAIWSRSADRRVHEAVRAQRIQIVHCHNLFPMLSPAVLRSAAAEGAAVLMTLHNYRMMCLSGTLFRDGRICTDCVGRDPIPGVVHRCYRGSRLGSGALASSLSLHRRRGTFDRVALYLAVSAFVRNQHVSAGFPAERIRVKRNFAWPAIKRAGPGEHFLYLGRLPPEKGVETILAAWKGITRRLLIVGDGPETERLRRVAPSRVELVGSRTPEQVRDLLSSARAVLVPSLWWEPASRVVLEAYASGVPVIASDTGGIPEAVRDGETGLLVPPGNQEAWRDAIGRLLDDGTAERMGEAGWRLWRDEYSPEHALAELEASYRTALAETRAR